MNKKPLHLSIQIYIGVALLLAGCFAGCAVYCARQSAQLRTYEFTADNLNAAQDGLSLSVTVSKQWDDDTLHPADPVGAQYDGVLTNNGALRFKDWSARLVFSNQIEIDSSWNGSFTANGTVLNFVAQDVPADVAPHSSATFGAVLYSTELMRLESFTLSGYRMVTFWDLWISRVLAGCALLWLVALLFHLVFMAKTARYRERRRLDSEIIKQSMNTFTGFIDAKDAYTKGHSARVAAYSAEIARRMKFKPEDAERLYYITLMHDCGKIGVPDSILKKPGKLTPEEFEIIRSHTVLGDSILLNFTAIPGIRDGAHYHHERYDGGGYPAGLRGEDIPLCARIICVADSYDAMSSNRCYRRRLEKDVILRELRENAGKQFDPRIVPYMVEMINDGFTARVQAEYPGADPVSDPRDAAAEAQA